MAEMKDKQTNCYFVKIASNININIIKYILWTFLFIKVDANTKIMYFFLVNHTKTYLVGTKAVFATKSPRT